VVLAIVAALWAKNSSGSTPGGSSSGSHSVAGSSGTVQVADLPKEARDTLKLIASGGPFPYPKNDGVVFGNNEGNLPKQGSGYYHEYTVVTPGSKDRGARRIITGGDKSKPSVYYYTDDHYASFRKIEGMSS
jgi:ribonuclease T1